MCKTAGRLLIEGFITSAEYQKIESSCKAAEKRLTKKK